MTILDSGLLFWATLYVRRCLKMTVTEKSVLAAKIDRESSRLNPAFLLPLRTKIELHFYERLKKSSIRPSLSRWNCMAEEVSKSVYHSVTGFQTCNDCSASFSKIHTMLYKEAVSEFVSFRLKKMLILLLIQYFSTVFQY